MQRRFLALWLLISFCFARLYPVVAQQSKIVVEADKEEAPVSSTLHGIFFEEISHGGEGGLYAELIQNRGFEESRIPPGCSLDSGWLSPPRTPHFASNKVSDWQMKWEPTNPFPAWSIQNGGKSKATISIDLDQPLNKATPQSLRVDIQSVDKTSRVVVVNEGFWGIRVDKDEVYNLTFYARTINYKAPIEVSLVGDNGKVLSSYVFSKLSSGGWSKYTCTLKATETNLKAKFQMSFNSKGTVWLDFVSLFPAKTFKNRPNGMRLDLAQYLSDLKPAFVRWPGGCFVEGISTESAPNWKRSIGPVEQRSGTYSPWGYWSSDGIGYHEFLQFCEDIKADAMYVFNCGVACEMRAGVYESDDHVPAIIEDVLNGIEYAIGPKDSKWGSVRAKNGHPAPFPLKYVEVGNEQVGPRYGKRFNIFYKAIKEKYPQLQILASMGISHLNEATVKSIDKMDIADEHAYKGIYWPMINYDWYDKYKRDNFKLYVGEYACNAGVGSGNMMAALNDAVYILGMERNSDMITMSSYAPLLENVNDTDWPVNLIRFDQAKSFARTSYYAIKMMNENKATVNVKTTVEVRDESKNLIPRYTGKIGLSTWDTQAEFKDIEISKAGEILYKSDTNNIKTAWQTEGGKWKAKNGILTQEAEGAWPMAVLNKNLDTYTLKLKAKKTGGFNAFMIPFAIKDSGYMRIHIGAWWNRVAAFEMVTDGVEAMVTQPVTLKKPIENDIWYDIEVRVSERRVECFLNGELLMTYSEPRSFFSIAGKDDQTGDVVVKVVNASDQKHKTTIQVEGTNPLQPTGEVITLSGESPTVENSIDNPMHYIPFSEVLNGVSNSFEYEFKPWSVTILRLKTK